MNNICIFCHKECSWLNKNETFLCENHENAYVKYIKINSPLLNVNEYTLIIIGYEYKDFSYSIQIHENIGIIIYYRSKYCSPTANYGRIDVNYSSNITLENIEGKLLNLLCFS